MSRGIEIVWPYIAAVIVVGAWYHVGSPFPVAAESLFGASATVASVFASFLGVSKAIMLTIKSSEIYQVLKEKGYTNDLFSYLRTGIVWSVVFAALSILGFFIDHKAILRGHNLFHGFEAAWVLAGILALCTYIRITNVLFKLLKHV